jgi:hypothetical protein
MCWDKFCGIVKLKCLEVKGFTHVRIRKNVSTLMTVDDQRDGRGLTRVLIHAFFA